MHKVYRFSYCNIVAVHSVDSKGGLFRERNKRHIIPAQFSDRGSPLFGEKLWRIFPESLWNNELLHANIYKRGWVFQERMLSPRILHFAENQIFWDCGTVSACETAPFALPQPLDNIAATDRHWRGRLQALATPGAGPVSGANDDSIEEFWRAALLNYSSCNLTKQKDKTIAIWSIAKLVRDIIREEYGCGMWEHGLQEQLAWRVADVRRCERVAELQWRNPSWSWGSVKGPVLARDRLALGRCYFVRNHDGQPITFSSPTVSLPAQASGPSHKTDDGLGISVLESTSVTSERDKEPILKDTSISIQGQICYGTLQGDNLGSAFSIIVAKTTPIAVGGSRSLHAFPDEMPGPDSFNPHACRFVVTAVSEQKFKSRVTYSGIGMLLATPKEFRNCYNKQLPELRGRLAKFPIDGNSWDKNSLIEDIDAVHKLLAQLTEQEERSMASQPHYRRVGAVEFRDIDEETWMELRKGPMEKFWLV